ncbi:MAG: AAA family ATPase, partial [Muribaculaceae bacterium]|nr:AAA family ATPase [Muribaculaceae bacterium]
MDEITYPIGDSSFTTIRVKNQFYVDKTGYIYRMASKGKYFFLSRPRRFGKSLLISTMEAYFKGQRELFNGLTISSLEKDWIQHPVLRFDLSADDMSKYEGLNAYLHATLSKWENKYGKDPDETSFGSRFAGIIERAYEQSGNGVVVLIDEYDNPLFSTIDTPDIHEKMRSTLKGLYSVLKSKADQLHFCFLTGITRFSKMSVFSGMNNLKDITLNPLYSGICGSTQKE